MSSLTIAYITARKDCRIQWFADSLVRQSKLGFSVIVVDRFHDEHGRQSDMCAAFLEAGYLGQKYRHVLPKPNVWNGPHRLTKEDWFAAASQRNTALCLCETTHIAYVDDLSVLMPDWLDAVNEAVAGNYIGCGAYKKVKNLVVKDGEPVGYVETPEGYDDRLRRVTEDISPCTGGWLYGCSLVAPVEDLLEVGGWPEYVDGMGAEDYTLGIALTNAGKHLKYCRKMLTLESDELHFVEPPMRKTDKGVSPNDKSHAALRIAQQSKYFPNYYPGGMRALREHVQAGGDFPTDQNPDRDWFDGQLISEME